ncbi:porphobilinogen synthase [Francisella philomiragia]|uniref:Delta-aminolevulinic acid dehydratase n=1 Tax=Francisella philomiragia subsp. philomiragia (strain ATCC 25017 / CCUG 19701 / FSC 153 / O\|nr:porphobilinogen synthase [Francisella philomiragia]AJI47098.1 delta-aminolevulinic acid dehydratase family protein [Francisella philomiragia]AJI50066.1 delta-aminolevulinic acid dehydratase family protein [Francisella philomiragia]MBK2020138.1 porphobilinogen synthase [Francisella philomiragia]MBK2029600.1 porphobilinogen synthase [Francisella philomiragia]MBK2263396.1 porphobilinogen synthase [Francisella philomiragia]
MSFPISRPRRLRVTQAFRDMVAETKLNIDDLMYPIFVVHGNGIKKEISSMPNQYHWSVDMLDELVEQVIKLGIKSLMIFGVPKTKDLISSENYDPNGITQQAIRKIKQLAPELVVATDVCMCSFTPHGHCGILDEHDYVDNDRTLEILQKTAISHAQAGADIVAPSGMMDGMIIAMRQALDESGFETVSIMSYSVKYASAYYGPFRSACSSSLKGDRKTYQMDYRNKKEAIREALADVEQGADFIMVKPALSYLDIINELSHIIELPIAAYHVSGEYAMIKAAANAGLVDEKAITIETLTSMKRAGAKIILTYTALDVANWIR